jgi:acetyltransferase-like isoleucine patch superfamily enzyme
MSSTSPKHQTNWIARKYSSFRRDPKLMLQSKLLHYWQMWHIWISTNLSRFSAWKWGVELGHGCKFWGITIFRRNLLSTIRIGKQCEFRSSFTSNLIGLNHPCAISTDSEEAKITIGDRCGFSSTVIASKESISIGNQVYCGANTVITDSDWHALDINNRLACKNIHSAPVIIEDNVWLGLNCVVLKGVHIGENTVVGANSIVIKSLPANVIAAGNPARVIRDK